LAKEKDQAPAASHNESQARGHGLLGHQQVEKIDYETEMAKAERWHEKRESDRSKMRG
jgi:hypothetical protein